MVARRTRIAVVAAALSLGGLTVAIPVPADESVDAATKKEAAKKFREGERAFKRHDYEKAANSFETANALAPHPAALYNAAKSWQLAGDLVRAANLCALYLRDAPENEKRRPKALKLIAELKPKLGRIEVTGDADDVEIDGTSPELDVTYVAPGDHTVTGTFDERTSKREVDVPAGSLVTVKLEPPKLAPIDDDDDDFDDFNEEPRDEEVQHEPEGWSPAVFYVGVGATAVLGATTIWSGMDTSEARDTFNANPTREGLNAGKDKQRRTNILAGFTGVAAIGTVVVGAFLTDWSGGDDVEKDSGEESSRGFRSVHVGVGLGSVTVNGRF